MSGFRKGFLASIAAVVVLAGLSSQVRAQALPREQEPNNLPSEANLLPLASFTIQGSSDLLGDQDFFQLELVTGNRVRAFLAGAVGQFDARVQILDAGGLVLAEAKKVGSSSTVEVIFDITSASGIGFVRVSNDLILGSGQSFSYILSVAQGVTEIEPNDAIAQAQPIGQDFPILGDFPSQGLDSDFYRITSTAPGDSVVILLDYPTSNNLDLGIQLLDSTGAVLAAAVRSTVSGSAGLKNPSLVVPLPVPGDYFLRVFNPGGQAQSVFNIGYAAFARLKTGLYEVEPNQSFAEAVLVGITEAGVVIGGSLQGPQDVDIYRIGLPPGRALVADLDATSPVVVMDSVVSAFLREDLGVSFASNDDSSILPAAASFSLVNQDSYLRVVPSRGGEVFVAVADTNNRGSAVGYDYNLTLKFILPAQGEVEPNNATAQAQRLEDSVAVRGTLGSASDIDTFIIAGMAGESLLVNVNAFGLGSFLDARVILRDPLGVVLVDVSQSTFSPDPFVLIPTLPSNGDYTVELRRRAGTSGSGASYYYEITASSESTLQAFIRSPDIDTSGRVDGFDLATLSRRFGTSLGNPLFDPAADLIMDDTIDGQDLAVLGEFFGGVLPASGLTGVLADPAGDAAPFFGPATDLPDLVGLGTFVSGSDLNIAAFYTGAVGTNTGGALSIDVDSSGFTGSLATADAYVDEQNLGSELEVFFDGSSFTVFAVPDPRSDILPAFIARVGDTRVSAFANRTADRVPPRAQIILEGVSSSSGNVITLELPASDVGGLTGASAALLALSVADVEPTDRLPNQGRTSLRPPFQVQSITVTQMLCQNDPKLLCQPASADADCGVASAVCLDANAPGPPVLPISSAVYLRTPDRGPAFVDFERGFFLTTFPNDNGSSQSNDTLDRVFPLGIRPLVGVALQWQTRDFLSNFGVRNARFDPHAFPGGEPPPDVDLYFFRGLQGDRAIIDVVTADQGATFNSIIELSSMTLSTAALDPSSSAAGDSVNASSLTLLATADDKSGVDLDPLLDFILPNTGLFLVKVTGSPAQPSFPGADVLYTLTHQTLRPDEVSIPIVLRGPYPSRLAGLNLEVTFDPDIIQVTGVDLARGLRDNQPPNLSFSSPQEIVVQPVFGKPGRSRVALRSFRGDGVNIINGLAGSSTAELTLARLRVRGVGPGTSTLRFFPNPTSTSEFLINLGTQSNDPTPTIFMPSNGFGPGVTVSVVATP